MADRWTSDAHRHLGVLPAYPFYGGPPVRPDLGAADIDVELRGVGQGVDHPTIGDVHDQLAQARDVDGPVEAEDECRHVPERHVQTFAVPALGRDVHQAGRCFQLEAGYRFLHRNHAGFQQRRHGADRIGAGHRHVVLGFHDDEADGRRGVRRRQHQVDALRDPAPRLVQQELAKIVPIRPQPGHLVEHRGAGNIEYAARDDLVKLAARMHADDVDHSLEPHRLSSERLNDRRRASSRSIDGASRRSHRARLFDGCAAEPALMGYILSGLSSWSKQLS